MSSSIERELVMCKQSAEEGYGLANAKYSDINNMLIDAAKRLSKMEIESFEVHSSLLEGSEAAGHGGDQSGRRCSSGIRCVKQ